MILAIILLQALAAAPTPGTFSFFQPSVTVSAEERSTLESGNPIARILPANGREDAVFGAIRVNVDGDRLVAWTRRVEQFKQGSYVLGIGRLSDPPRIEDFANVSLDAEDLQSIRNCHPGSCGVKLSAQEMTRLHKVAGRNSDNDALQQEFRQLLLERAQLYLRTGNILQYDDQHAPLSPTEHFTKLLDQTSFLSSVPQFSDYLRNYPAVADPQVESFIYWSKEHAAGKAIISMTHVNIVRNQAPNLPDTLIVSRDIFSTHYVDASLSVTALISNDDGGPSYLVYLNRTEIDVLHGAFSGVVRHAMQHRVKASATGIIEDYRHRLESGEPPAAVSTEKFPRNPRNYPDAAHGDSGR